MAVSGGLGYGVRWASWAGCIVIVLGEVACCTYISYTPSGVESCSLRDRFRAKFMI